MDISQYLGMFLEESREHLQTLNESLLKLEQEPDNVSVLDAIFRSAHTIKGMSATMGYNTVAELTHEMENVLDGLRKSQLTINRFVINTLFQCVDALEQMIESIATNTEKDIDIAPLVDKLAAISKGEEESPFSGPPEEKSDQENDLSISGDDLNETELKVIRSAAAQGIESYKVKVVVREGTLLKSARAYMVIRALDELGDVIKTVPSVDDLEKENFERSFEVILVTDAEKEKIIQTLDTISELEKVEIIPYRISNPSRENELLEVSPEKGKAAADESPIPVARAEEKQLPVGKQGLERKIKSGQSLRVDIDKLDTLLNLVGELVINKTRLEQIGLTHRLTDLIETIEHMDRVTTDLQAVVMKVRMVPVGQVFNRFPRMVRDLSRELNKEINFIIQGEETELDRTVIDEIGDPLVHLLRNSIDHGIEHPAERQAKGKNPVGEIRLIARHEGNNVIIEVEDDGQGMDPETIRRKAVEKGLITQAEADKIEAAEAIKLAFLPGFSTADNVTDISGRGVGLDAVKTKIESLGGNVEVETKVNEGSKFKIRLPLTLAIIQALLIKVGEEIYAIPLGSIDSTINVAPNEIKTIQNQEVILLRGQIIPIVRLASVLNVMSAAPTARQTADSSELFIVIVHMGDRKAGIIVDNLIGQQEIVIKSLGKLLAGIKVIAGATILGNGQVALILDVGSLIAR